jgi:hypothetical protein
VRVFKKVIQKFESVIRNVGWRAASELINSREMKPLIKVFNQLLQSIFFK